MLYASAAFLFLFLPLALGVFALSPERIRRYVLLIVGVTFYVLANLKTPVAIPVLAIVLVVTYTAGRYVSKSGGRALCAGVISLDIAAFFVLRIISESSGGAVLFPLGASVYLLMSISYIIDVRRGDCETPSFFDTALYLTFFPVIVAGPVVKFKDFKKYIGNMNFNINNFALGIRRFITGFVAYIAVAAVLTDAYERIIEVSGYEIFLPFGLVTVALILLSSFFAIAGWSDMACGVALMFGVSIPRDCTLAPSAYSPGVYFAGILRGLRGWIEDYLTAPISLLLKKQKKLSDAAGIIIMISAMSLWIKTTAVSLAAALIVAAAAAVIKLTGAEDLMSRKKYLRPTGWLLTAVLLSFFWIVISMDNIGGFTSLLGQFSLSSADYRTYYIYITLSGSKYITVAAAALFLMPLSYYGGVLSARIPRKLRAGTEAATVLLMLGAFVFSLLFFMPQFPQYASRAFEYLTF